MALRRVKLRLGLLKSLFDRPEAILQGGLYVIDGVVVRPVHEGATIRRTKGVGVMAREGRLEQRV
jgi:hypothetical protein